MNVRGRDESTPIGRYGAFGPVRWWACVSMFVLLMAGCKGAGVTMERSSPGRTPVGYLVEESGPRVPPGVDSVYAARADSLANVSFVSFSQEVAADSSRREGLNRLVYSDSLWAILTTLDSTSVVLLDTTAAMLLDPSAAAATDGGASVPAGANSAALLDRSRFAHALSSDDPISALQAYHVQMLEEAEAALREATESNPFDVEAAVVLASLHRRRATRLATPNEYQHAIDLLKDVRAWQPGEHVVAAELGRTYFLAEAWAEAVEAYGAAERNLLHTRLLRDDTTFTHADSLDWFDYLYRQGDAYTSLQQAPEALESFHGALKLVPSPADRDAIESTIAFIQWDEGNIAASEARLDALRLQASGELEEAEQAFLALHPQLQTPSARDEIDWRLALLESQQGRQEQAGTRLAGLVERISFDSETGMPLDTTYVKYVEAYGQVQFNLAEYHHESQRDLRTAISYYRQAIRVPWSGRGTAYLKIATLLRNNAPEAIPLAEQGLEVVPLSQEDRRRLYILLTSLYRHTDVDKARFYNQLARSM